MIKRLKEPMYGQMVLHTTKVYLLDSHQENQMENVEKIVWRYGLKPPVMSGMMKVARVCEVSFVNENVSISLFME